LAGIVRWAKDNTLGTQPLRLAFVGMSQQGLGLLANQGGMAVPAVAGGIPAPPASDDYFAGEAGTIAVFDFDYETMIAFNSQLRRTSLAWCPVLWPTCLCCYPCFIKQNAEWDARSQHVALTVDGIRYVREKRKFCCGLSCSDRGKESKTVPYDKITDCDVKEPAGAAFCCCVPRVLSQVHVDTASSGATKDGIPTHELQLNGLRFAGEFKAAVWSMKRGEAPTNAVVPLRTAAPGMQQMASAPGQESMNTQLLFEIRDELRTLNANINAGKDSPYPLLQPRP